MCRPECRLDRLHAPESTRLPAGPGRLRCRNGQREGTKGSFTKLVRPSSWKTRWVAFAESSGLAQKMLGTNLRGLRSQSGDQLLDPRAGGQDQERGPVLATGRLAAQHSLDPVGIEPDRPQPGPGDPAAMSDRQEDAVSSSCDGPSGAGAFLPPESRVRQGPDPHCRDLRNVYLLLPGPEGAQPRGSIARIRPCRPARPASRGKGDLPCSPARSCPR
jgi:hypothetical protein